VGTTSLEVLCLAIIVSVAISAMKINLYLNAFEAVNQYKYMWIVLDTELSDDKDIQGHLRYQYCAANKLRASFSRCSNTVKNVLFHSFCTFM